MQVKATHCHGVGATQCSRPNGRLNSAITSDCHNTIVLEDSVRVSVFVMRNDAANNGALASMMSVNQPSSPASLGATTTNMPENPSNAATHRSQRMRSPKNQAAPSMTKMGPVNPMAVVSARPMRGRAMNHSIKAVVCTAPRHIWPLRLLGR